MGGCSPRDYEDASVDGVGRCYLEVVTFEI